LNVSAEQGWPVSRKIVPAIPNKIKVTVGNFPGGTIVRKTD
jgi:hypothetical protein